MIGNIIRLTLVIAASLGIYQFVPAVHTTVNSLATNPKLQSQIVLPVAKIANKILPSKLQIPTSAVMGASTDSSDSGAMGDISKEIKNKASQLAEEQIKQIKKAAGDQFCQILIERIKTECGQ